VNEDYKLRGVTGEVAAAICEAAKQESKASDPGAPVQK
jgi:hypothetical protein